MHVLLNTLTALRRKTGIGHYVTELVRALRVRFPESRFSTFPGAWVAGGARAWGLVEKGLTALKKRSQGNARKTATPSVRKWLGNRARSLPAWHFRALWSYRSFDLYHEPNYIPYPCDRPTIATVHDLSALLHPEWHPAERAAHYQQHFEAGIRRCVHLLADSEFTRRELIDHVHVAPDRITVVPLGMRADLRPLPRESVDRVLQRLNLPHRFLLHVGTIEPRKNLLMLLKAYCDLPRQAREKCPLVFAGGWGWQADDIAEYYHGTAKARGVIHLGYVPDADLPALYNAAQALVFPSHYEGFGLPPLEMLACGGAVLAATAGAVVETVGQQAHCIDAHDQDAWRSAMHGVITDEDWRAMLRRGAAEVARPYTWQSCADKTWQVYDIVSGQKPDVMATPAKNAA